MSIILFVCLNRFYISLVTMNTFCKLFVNIDLTSLHYVTFIKPFVISPIETLSFDSEEFTNTSINNLIVAKDKDPFLFFKEHFFRSVVVYRNSHDVHFKDM
jgi:hypothetical protein